MQRQNTGQIWRWAVVALLLALFAQATLAVRATSITIDEPLHITSGYACLLTGDYRLVEEHPPLLKMLQAAPLLLAQPPLPDPRTVPGWAESNLIEVARHVVSSYRPLDPLVTAARVPTLLVAIVLAALVYRWAADLFGPRAGVLALFLCAFDPNLLAHASVAATDLGAAAAILASSYTFWRWLRQRSGPHWRRMVPAAFVLGMALGVKSTALLLVPVFGLLLLVARPVDRPLRAYLGQTVAAGGLAFLTLWAIYRFEIGIVPGVPFPIPMPSHLLPLQKLQQHLREGHAAFLLGQNYHHGDWRYFPVAFALKTPPLTLGLLLWTLYSALSRQLSQRFTGDVSSLPSGRRYLPLLLFPLLYAISSLSSGINIGYRHLLPLLPFVFIGTSQIVSWFHAARPYWRWGGAALLTGYAAVTLTLSPWYLAYFNLFAGGPDGGYRYLVDSNLDWGQTWKALKRYLDARGIQHFWFSHYTINDPHAYGLEYDPLPPWPDAPPVLPRRFNPAPGVYAISTTQLQGVVVADPEMFDYFRKQEPTARIGHAVFVYDLAPTPPAQWAAQCTWPVASLSAEQLTEGLGHTDLRLAAFDCSQSWLYPAGNGWYVLPRAISDWQRAQLQGARLAYEQKRTGFTPPFAVFEAFGLTPLTGITATPVRAAPVEWPPAQVLTAGTIMTPPVALGETLAFLGYLVESPTGRAGQLFSVATYWRVLTPPGALLSLMAHLLRADGTPVAVGDGLGVPVEQWQPGDIIVQRHTFQLPPETAPGPLWLSVGAYGLPQVQRLPVSLNGAVVGDRLVVAQLEVTR